MGRKSEFSREEKIAAVRLDGWRPDGTERGERVRGSREHDYEVETVPLSNLSMTS